MEKWYVHEEALTVKLFKPDGTRMFERHPVNNRVQKTTRTAYRKIILEQGLIQDARGDPVCVATTLNPETWMLLDISFGTLFDATYDAIEEAGDTNAQVQSILRTGIKKVKVLVPKTPTAALVHWRDLLNQFVGFGATTSFLEHYHIVVGIHMSCEEAMKNEKKALKATAKDDDSDDSDSSDDSF